MFHFLRHTPLSFRWFSSLVIKRKNQNCPESKILMFLLCVKNISPKWTKKKSKIIPKVVTSKICETFASLTPHSTIFFHLNETLVTSEEKKSYIWIEYFFYYLILIWFWMARSYGIFLLKSLILTSWTSGELPREPEKKIKQSYLLWIETIKEMHILVNIAKRSGRVLCFYCLPAEE